MKYKNNIKEQAGEESTEIQRQFVGLKAQLKKINKLWHETELNFNTLAEMADEAIIVYQKKEIVYANPAAEKMTGYDRRELKSDFMELVHPLCKNMIKKQWLKLLRNRQKSISNVIKIISRNGHEMDIKVNATKINYNEKPSIIAIAKDIANHTQIKNKTKEYESGEKNYTLDAHAPNRLLMQDNHVVGLAGVTSDMSGQKWPGEALRESENRYRTIFETTGAATIIVEEKMTISLVNREFEELSGYSKTEIENKRSFLDFIFKEDIDILNNNACKTNQLNTPVNCELRFISRRSGIRNVHLTANYIPGTKKRVISILDITERKKIEKKLRENEAHLRYITDNILDIIAQIGVGGILRYVGPSIEGILGYKPGELIGSSIFSLIHPDDLEMALTTCRKARGARLPGGLEFRYRHAEGYYLWLETVGNILFDNNGNITGAILNARDITRRKRMEEQLRYLSFHDPLTGLYNRTYFEQEMHRLEGDRHSPIGIVICDVDGLKFINDTFGHKTGDALLMAAAGAIKKSFRAGDMIARIGGDEFAVLLPECDGESVNRACQRIKNHIKEYNASDSRIFLSISIGYAVSGAINTNLTQIFKEADNNMYREKLRRSQNARNDIVQTLMKALEIKGLFFEEHAQQVQNLVIKMANIIGLPQHKIRDLRLLAQFHDIGKVSTPETILFKPDPLTPEERVELQRHCEIGHRIAHSTPDLLSIADWILKCHEWWNGQGYPIGLKGEEIPLECRILAIADAYEAMISERPYRHAISGKEALKELRRCAGTQFDPSLVKIFIEMKMEEKQGKNP